MPVQAPTADAPQVLPADALPADAAPASHLPALILLVVAITGWSFGSDWRDEVPALKQQVGTAAKVAGRTSGVELEALRADARRLADERAGLEARLRSNDSEQTVRARLVNDLREQCLQTGAANCVVRLADEALAPSSAVRAQKAQAGDSNPTLDDLGIRRARALVSGSFAADEPMRLVDALQGDRKAVWRLNGVVVRGNTFEIDAERHTRPPTEASVK